MAKNKERASLNEGQLIKTKRQAGEGMDTPKGLLGKSCVQEKTKPEGGVLAGEGGAREKRKKPPRATRTTPPHPDAPQARGRGREEEREGREEN